MSVFVPTSSPRHRFRRPLSFVCASALSVIFGAALPIGCENTPQVEGDDDTLVCDRDEDCTAGQFCEKGQCLDECASCGTTCEKTEECPVGQFCSQAGVCQQACVPGGEGECPNGMICNDDGRCAAKNDIEVPVGGAGGKS